MKARVLTLVMALLVIAFVAEAALAQKMKIGYINSQKILQNYKEAQDAQKKFDEINAGWEAQVREMQRQLQELSDQLESQSLLLSEQRKQEKQQEIQNLYMSIQQFQMEKWGQNGEAFRKERELMEPIINSITAVIKKIGEAEGFTYIFDGVNGNIVYAAPDQPDLTDRVIEELNKSVKTTGSKG